MRSNLIHLASLSNSKSFLIPLQGESCWLQCQGRHKHSRRISKFSSPFQVINREWRHWAKTKIQCPRWVQISGSCKVSLCSVSHHNIFWVLIIAPAVRYPSIQQSRGHAHQKPNQSIVPTISYRGLRTVISQ